MAQRCSLDVETAPQPRQPRRKRSKSGPEQRRGNGLAPIHSAAMTRPLKVGVQLPEVERPVRWPELRDMAQTAEGIGLDSIWAGDHLLYRRETGNVGPWEVWTSLAGLAEATKKVELGPLVAATSFHAPAMLAKMAATVDEISGGRLILGLGAGWNEPDYTPSAFRTTSA